MPNHRSNIRVAKRYLQAMAAIIHNVPNGFDWGFFSREEPRMHLQVVNDNRPCKVWLESKGERVFIPVSGVAGKSDMSKKEQAALFRELERSSWQVEHRWVGVMIQKGWLKLNLRAYPVIRVEAYAGTSGAYHRDVDLDTEFPGLVGNQPPAESFFLDPSTAAISTRGDKTPDISLVDLLFTGTRVLH